MGRVETSNATFVSFHDVSWILNSSFLDILQRKFIIKGFTNTPYSLFSFIVLCWKLEIPSHGLTHWRLWLVKELWMPEPFAVTSSLWKIGSNWPIGWIMTHPDGQVQKNSHLPYYISCSCPLKIRKAWREILE